jgi:hypothetical protein
MEAFSGQMQDSTRWSPSAKHRWHTIQTGVLIIKPHSIYILSQLFWGTNNWNFRGEGAEDLSVHHQLCTCKERNVVISTSYLTTQVCRLPMWFAIAMLPPQLRCTLGTMMETKGSITHKKLGSSNRKEPEICTVWTKEEASRHNSLPLPLPLLVFFSLPLSQSKEKFVGFLQQPSPSHSITRTSQLSEKTRSSSLSGSFQFHPQRWRRQCAPISLSLHSIWNPRSLCQSPFLLSVTASSSLACDHVDIKSGFPSISVLQ